MPRLAYVATGQDNRLDESVEIVDLDLASLIERGRTASRAYVSAKIVIVGESGVGKTGLGWRQTHGEFVEHASTHGQQFWLLDELATTRADGAHCEAVLWDLAGQPDYRLINALFVGDADLALIVFDPTRDDDPLRGVDYWLRQLGIKPIHAPAATQRHAILVSARADRGTPQLGTSEILRFCRQRGIRSFVTTSAKSGEGLERLTAEMRAVIPWDDKPTTVTTRTFKVIKDHVLRLKERRSSDQVTLAFAELRALLERNPAAGSFSDGELRSAVGHLATHGYVTLLLGSIETRILLAPELLNNVAASIVLQARRNPQGLGSLEEQHALDGDYLHSEFAELSAGDRAVLIDSAITMFLQHNICFRETHSLSSRVYLVFPQLINLRKPSSAYEQSIEEGAAYTVTGAVENLYASLVVQLGYTGMFTRATQWRDHAQYTVDDGTVCGFRLAAEGEGELELVLYFSPQTLGFNIRTRFQSFFENLLARRGLTVFRDDPVVCHNGHHLHRTLVRESVAKGRTSIFCPDCGDRVELRSSDAPVALTSEQALELRAQRHEVARRSKFEQALFRLNSYVRQANLAAPSCFLSYAHGDAAELRWVEMLATDLAKAGVIVFFDRWMPIGVSVAEFVKRIESSDYVLVVGTPAYRMWSDMGHPSVAVETEVVAERVHASRDGEPRVLPLLHTGTSDVSFPTVLQNRVHADVRDPARYLPQILGVILTLYAIPREALIHIDVTRLLEQDSEAEGGHEDSTARPST